MNGCLVTSWNNVVNRELLRNYFRKVVQCTKLLCAICSGVRSNFKFRNRSRRSVIINKKLFSTLGSGILKYTDIYMPLYGYLSHFNHFTVHYTKIREHFFGGDTRSIKYLITIFTTDMLTQRHKMYVSMKTINFFLQKMLT